MTDGSGNIQARYDYDPFGRVKVITGTVPSDFQYAGYYEHATSGLNLTQYRAYDPNTARWLSRDPIGERGGSNLYGYVRNNPIRFIDPLGLLLRISGDDNFVHTGKKGTGEKGDRHLFFPRYAGEKGDRHLFFPRYGRILADLGVKC